MVERQSKTDKSRNSRVMWINPQTSLSFCFGAFVCVVFLNQAFLFLFMCILDYGVLYSSRTHFSSVSLLQDFWRSVLKLSPTQNQTNPPKASKNHWSTWCRNWRKGRKAPPNTQRFIEIKVIGFHSLAYDFHAFLYDEKY